MYNSQHSRSAKVEYATDEVIRETLKIDVKKRSTIDINENKQHA